MKTMHLALLGALMFAAPASLVGTAHAQVPDHHKCYKIKDALNLSGTARLDTPQFGVDPGCKISKAKLFCVPGTKTNVSVTDKTTGLPIAPLPFSGPPQPGDEICYKVKCPTPVTPIADQAVTDQFGNRTLTKFKASYLCTPAVKGLAYCGDGTIGAGEQCEGANLNGATCASIGFTGGGTLACTDGCQFDTTACVCASTANCGNGAREGNEQCDGADLAGTTCASLGYTGGTLSCSTQCAFDTGACTRTMFPATGQTTCWDTSGAVIPCAGSGQDGDSQAGATLSYTDNGDGTITDNNTALMWEKLADDGSIHDKDTVYTWANAFAVKIATLNTPSCFAGHCDWRLPNRAELESIANLQNNPSVSAAFLTGCAAACTVLTCSCTVSDFYWSSTTFKSSPTFVWGMKFDAGGVFAVVKTNSSYVRAVRGGL